MPQFTIQYSQSGFRSGSVVVEAPNAEMAMRTQDEQPKVIDWQPWQEDEAEHMVGATEVASTLVQETESVGEQQATNASDGIDREGD